MAHASAIAIHNLSARAKALMDTLRCADASSVSCGTALHRGILRTANSIVAEAIPSQGAPRAAADYRFLRGFLTAVVPPPLLEPVVVMSRANVDGSS